MTLAREHWGDDAHGLGERFDGNLRKIDLLTDLAAVLAAMGSGATYVNVHTNDGVAPPNTGPGDFPGGEIRGQIRAGGNINRRVAADALALLEVDQFGLDDMDARILKGGLGAWTNAGLPIDAA